MRIKEAKWISITDYLSREGHKPVKTRLGDRESWFSSPLRSGDSTPSFKVDNVLNLWFDHGLAVWGDIINLVRELHQTTTRDALSILESSKLNHSFHPSAWSKQTQNWLFSLNENDIEKFAGEKEKGMNDGYFTISSVWKIQSPALFEYLQSRKIDFDVAQEHLEEIRFKPRNLLHDYFAVGWPNGNGFEARSKLFKGFVGTSKDISRINLSNWKSLSIFEGFFDYLSFLSHYWIKKLGSSVIVLNSTSLRKRALTEINKYAFTEVFLFLDNDVAGDDCKQFFKLWIDDIKVIDKSYLYENHCDLNDWVMSQ